MEEREKGEYRKGDDVKRMKDKKEMVTMKRKPRRERAQEKEEEGDKRNKLRGEEGEGKRALEGGGEIKSTLERGE